MAKKAARAGQQTQEQQFWGYSNVHQVGGIETSVIDDGPGKGVRIAWVNTGSGLRYKVVIDRGLDIADAFFNAHSLTWLSYGGIVAPQRAYDIRDEWLRSYIGGLVPSCGPTSAGAPCVDQGEPLGCHGLHSNTPASLESIIQPDPHRGKTDFSLTGSVKTAKCFGPEIELRRTISGELGRPVIRIRDEFINRGDTTSPHQWLLHINLGWPLVDTGARFIYRGKVIPRGDSHAWFSNPRKYKRVPGPLDEHRGRDESVAYIEPQTDRSGQARIGLVNDKLGMGVAITFNRKQFPRWVNWQHFSPGGMFVTGIEPANCGVEGRNIDRERGWLDHIEPGQTKVYDCEIEVLGDAKAAKEFAREYGD